MCFVVRVFVFSKARGVNMKKIVKIAAVVLLVVIVVVAILSRNDGFVSGVKNLSITSSAEPKKVLDFYIDVVENTVNEKDFKFDVKIGRAHV